MVSPLHPKYSIICPKSEDSSWSSFSTTVFVPKIQDEFPAHQTSFCIKQKRQRPARLSCRESPRSWELRYHKSNSVRGQDNAKRIKFGNIIIKLASRRMPRLFYIGNGKQPLCRMHQRHDCLRIIYLVGFAHKKISRLRQNIHKITVFVKPKARDFKDDRLIRQLSFQIYCGLKHLVCGCKGICITAVCPLRNNHTRKLFFNIY